MKLEFKPKKAKDLKFADLFKETENGRIFHVLEKPEIADDGKFIFLWYEDVERITGHASLVKVDKEVFVHEHNEEFHETGILLVPLSDVSRN